MKFLTAILVIACTLTSLHAIDPKTSEAYDFNKRTQLIEWVEQLRKFGNDAKAHADEVTAKLVIAYEQRNAAQQETIKTQADIQTLTAAYVKRDGEAIKAVQERDQYATWYHGLKFYCVGALAGLAALIVGILIFRFAAPALNTVPGLFVAFGVPLATFAGVSGFLWAKL